MQRQQNKKLLCSIWLLADTFCCFALIDHERLLTPCEAFYNWFNDFFGKQEPQQRYLPYHFAFLWNTHRLTPDNAPSSNRCVRLQKAGPAHEGCALSWTCKLNLGAHDACESLGWAQCLDGADMLCWNLTVTDRWSSLSLFWPLLLFCFTLPVCDVYSE